MAKRKRNKQVKQMIADIVLDGRKAFWHGETTEIFAAQSVSQLNEEFGLVDEDLPEDEQGGLVSANYKWWWGSVLCEIEGKRKGQKPNMRKDTPEHVKKHYEEHYQCLPAICFVFKDGNSISQISTSYN